MRDHKRKRSSSIDISGSIEQHPYEHDSSNPSRPQHLANRALRVLRNANEPGRGHPLNLNGSAQDAHTWQDPRPPQSTGHVNDGLVGRPGAQLAELLQQDTIEVLQPHGGQLPGPNDEVQTSCGATPPQYPREMVPGVVSTGPKRKRNFSNRTKTGCMTCRTRKKKCDERHPHCERNTLLYVPLSFTNANVYNTLRLQLHKGRIRVQGLYRAQKDHLGIEDEEPAQSTYGDSVEERP